MSARRTGSAILILALCACGDAPLHGTFTSRVVQFEVCTTLGDRPETCQRAETLLDLQVELRELEDESAWLTGVPRSGVSNRALLGTRDAEGGFLFVEELSRANSDTGCSVTERIELSLSIDPEADPATVGTDPCVALVGREYVVTTSSPGCDAVNEPPLEETRIARRRWQPPPSCGE